MSRALPASTLWALHPRYLQALYRHASVDGIMPDVVRRLAASVAGGRSLEAAAEPVREGLTMILPIVGILAPSGFYAGGTSYDDLADRVRDAAADKRVDRIVLDVRSAGGTVWGCDEAADAIYAARAAKPVISVASPFCFSAAYWLATQASQFYVTPSGEVGSIGVRSGHMDMSSFEEKIGMRTTLIASSADKIAGHPHAPLSDDDRAEIQAGVDEAAGRFRRAIARGRGMRLAEVPRVHGSGRTVSAPRALRNGAVDGVATLQDVVRGLGLGQVRLTLKQRQAALTAMMVDI